MTTEPTNPAVSQAVRSASAECAEYATHHTHLGAHWVHPVEFEGAIQRAIDSETARLIAAQSITIPEEGVAPDKGMVVGLTYVAELLARATKAEAKVERLKIEIEAKDGDADKQVGLLEADVERLRELGHKAVAQMDRANIAAEAFRNDLARSDAERDTARKHAKRLRNSLELFGNLHNTPPIITDQKEWDELCMHAVRVMCATLSATDADLASFEVCTKEELVQLRKDRERLDWIEGLHGAQQWRIIPTNPKGFNIFKGSSCVAFSETIRSAIDAAIAAEAKGRGTP